MNCLSHLDQLAWNYGLFYFPRSTKSLFTALANFFRFQSLDRKSSWLRHFKRYSVSWISKWNFKRKKIIWKHRLQPSSEVLQQLFLYHDTHLTLCCSLLCLHLHYINLSLGPGFKNFPMLHNSRLKSLLSLLFLLCLLCLSLLSSGSTRHGYFVHIHGKNK